MRRVLLALLLFTVATSSFAWGEKGHLISNEAATFGLPHDMPLFFYQRFPELIWLGPDPDRWKGGGESVDADNSPEHFLDYEFVAGLTLSPNRYKYIDTLYTSGRLRQKRLEVDDPGFLPWRIAELAQTLQVEFRNWRFSAPGSSERRAIENDIIHIAGVLGHYVSDGANPHHTTMHHNGWVALNPKGYATDCQTHSRFESRFVEHAVDVRDVIPKLAKPVERTDYFKTALDHVLESNSKVETLYTLDRDGAFDLLRKTISKEGHAFATDRLAVGASLLRDLWWSAWKNSAKPPRRRGDD